MAAPPLSSERRLRVALFQSFWRLHSSTLFAARSLAEAGYGVDLFLFNVDTTIPMDFLNGVDGVSIHSFDRKPSVSSKNKIMAAFQLGMRITRYLMKRTGETIRWPWNWLLLKMRSDRGLVPRRIVDRTIEVMQGRKYIALIGVEKSGLLWAGAIEHRYPAALIYSSLELYTHSHPLPGNSIEYQRTKLAEEAAHRRCWATIIQDPVRGRLLCEDNGVTPGMRMLYVPISRWGTAAAADAEWWRNELGIDRERIVILSYGLIHERRLCVELTQMAQDFPCNWLLVFHGWGSRSVIQRIHDADRKKKVRISSRLVETSEEHNIVGAADISLVLYKTEPPNDRLTGFSSEKLAISLQCGVPVIAFNYPTYEHIGGEGSGVLVDDLRDIPNAIKTILSDREAFRRNATASFERQYSFETNFQTVLNALALLDLDG